MSIEYQSEIDGYEKLIRMTPSSVRQEIRNNSYAGHTAGLCDGKLQCNLAVLNYSVAKDFESFCQLNAIACPLLDISSRGDPCFRHLDKEMDLRTDLPSYNIYQLGKKVAQVKDVKKYWTDDLIAFAIGCSFTFERALLDAGIPVRHRQDNHTVPMFRTNIPLKQAGPFGGSTVVSMRPIPAHDIDKLNAICGLYPHAHGAPLHVGDPEEIGIQDITSPDWGDAARIADDDILVFWGCGVSSQEAILKAKLDMCITHSPGAMLITYADELSSIDQLSANH